MTSSRTNAPAYGADAFTARATTKLSDVFETKVEAFLVATGTGANALALSALVRPWEAVFCHEESHIHDDECGAPELFTGGAKLVGVPGEGGKITPEALRETLTRFPRGLVKSPQPGALSLSQATEAGTIYSVSEIAELCRIARAEGVRTHMDGARFANAIVSSGVSPADMTWRAGIDALSLARPRTARSPARRWCSSTGAGGELRLHPQARRPHAVQGAFLGAQMEAYLGDGLWLRLAERANAAARRLGAACRPRRASGSPGQRKRTKCSRSRRTRRSPLGALPARSSTNGARVRSPRNARRAPEKPWSGW